VCLRHAAGGGAELGWGLAADLVSVFICLIHGRSMAHWRRRGRSSGPTTLAYAGYFPKVVLLFDFNKVGLRLSLALKSLTDPVKRDIFFLI